jgi:hypothetical protein
MHGFHFQGKFCVTIRHCAWTSKCLAEAQRQVISGQEKSSHNELSSSKINAMNSERERGKSWTTKTFTGYVFPGLCPFLCLCLGLARTPEWKQIARVDGRGCVPDCAPDAARFLVPCPSLWVDHRPFAVPGCALVCGRGGGLPYEPTRRLLPRVSSR